MKSIADRVLELSEAQVEQLAARLSSLGLMGHDAGERNSSLSANPQQLIAYYTVTGHESISHAPQIVQGLDVDSLRTHVQSRLPDYMCPSVFVPLSQIPRLPNGKINSASLPAPPAAEKKKPAPASNMGSSVDRVISIFRELLALDDVRAEDNFFEMGGDSITAIQMCARIEEQIGVHVSLRNLLECANLEALAAIIDAALKVSEKQVVEHGDDMLESGEI